jgi:UDP-glucose 4-epimerase
VLFRSNKITAELIDVMGVEVEPIHADPIPGEVRHIYLDVDLAEREIAWKAETELKGGLKKTAEWIRNA